MTPKLIARNQTPRIACVLLATAACVSLTGCFGFLKRPQTVARNFVLTPLPAAASVPAPPGAPGVGLGQVKMPEYLFNSSFAIRVGTNEINYLPAVLWAERLDNGLQRVLAANLGTLLGTDHIRLSAWRSEDVSLEVYVAFERFDVDTGGQGVLVAWWRILSPGGEKTLKVGETRLVREGAPPETNPAGAVATMSELVADLSRKLAQACQEAMPRQAAPVPR
jgi:uncharacterized lipoprotein YmbA